MLVIKIELHPGGDASKARCMGSAVIINDASGTQELGNYKALFFDSGLPDDWRDQMKAGNGLEVMDFQRLKEKSWDLVRRFLNKRNYASRGLDFINK
mgnify:CR=1 FL=1